MKKSEKAKRARARDDISNSSIVRNDTLSFTRMNERNFQILLILWKIQSTLENLPLFDTMSMRDIESFESFFGG